MSKFYNFINKKEAEEAELYIEGELVEDGWEREFISDFYGGKATASSEFSEQLKGLNGKTLKIHCNSVGGSLFAGTAIYCALTGYKGKKIGYIDSICASAATFPMLACDKTYMTAASGYCAHLPMIAMCAFGNKNDLKEAYEETIAGLEQIESVMVDAYKRKTGMSSEKIRNILAKDEIMSASKTIELGFVDGYTEDEPKYDKAFVENMFRRNVMVYNFLKPKYKNEEEQEEKETQEETNEPTIKIDKPDSLQVGDTGTFSATVENIDGEIKWETSDEEIISVSENGEYEAKSTGNATITASIEDYSDSVEIEVKEKEKTEETDEEIENKVKNMNIFNALLIKQKKSQNCRD